MTDTLAGEELNAPHDDRLPSINGVQSPEPTEFRKLAVASGLLQMFRGRYFNICTLDAAAKALCVERRLAGPDYDALRALHCVDWADMPPDLPPMVRQQCLEFLQLPPATIPAQDIPSRAALGLLRLLGRK